MACTISTQSVDDTLVFLFWILLSGGCLISAVDDPEELEMHVNNDASLASDQDQQQAEDDDDISMASSISMC